MIKIKELELDNFAGFDKVEVSFDKDLNYLIGGNGAGKTTIGLTGLWFIMQGIAEKSYQGTQPLIGERFRFIGDKAGTAKGVLTLIDDKIGEIKVIRKLTKQGSELTFEGPEGIELNQRWLNDLFNVFLISPKSFIDLSAKEQALALGINMSEYDKDLSELKEQYTFINRDIKSLGVKTEVPAVEMVDVKSLLDELAEVNKYNQEVYKQKQSVIALNGRINDCDTRIEKILVEIENLQAELKRKKSEKEAISKQMSNIQVSPEKPTEEISKKIKDAESINDKSREYKSYLEWKTAKEKLDKRLIDNKRKQADVEKRKLEYIQKFDLPFKELSINDQGELLLNDRPLKEQYFSTGQLLKIVPVLISTCLAPDFKYVFLQNFNLIDETNREQIIEHLTKQGFQLVIEWVGKNEGQPNAITLKDCKIVGKETEEKPNLI